MEKNIVINRLPAKTWNWLKMNETKISMETAEKACDVIEKVPNAECVRLEKQAPMQEIETGMGKEVAELLPEGETARKINTLFIPENSIQKEPIVLEYEYVQEGRYFDQLQIQAEENSEVTVILLYRSKDGMKISVSNQTKVYAKENAKVHLYTIQLLSKNTECLCDFGGRCEKDAQIMNLQLQLGAGKIYTGASTELSGERSNYQMDIGYLAEGTERVDMNYVVRHIGKKTESQITATGILKDKAFKLFRGTLDFITGCSGAKGAESEDVLLLSEDVVNQTIPLILCGEEDVEGSHGATIGKLDEQILFYLGSRGFERKEAEQLVAKAKMDALCSMVPSQEMQEKIQSYLEERIHEGL